MTHFADAVECFEAETAMKAAAYAKTASIINKCKVVYRLKAVVDS